MSLSKVSVRYVTLGRKFFLMRFLFSYLYLFLRLGISWTPTTIVNITDIGYFWTPTTPLALIDPCCTYRTPNFSMMSLSMDKKCCVPNCNATRLDNIILHCFPNPHKEPERFRSWLYAVRGDILALKNEYIFKYRRVCHRHFESRFYTISRRLCANAIPTLDLPQIFTRRQYLTQSRQDTQARQETQTQPRQDAQARQEMQTQPRQENPDENDMNFINKIENVQSIGTHQNPESKIKKRPLEEKRTLEEASGGPRTKKKPLSVMYGKETAVLSQKIRKLQKAKDTYASKLKKALKLSENTAFQRRMANFTTAAAIFLNMQFREVNKGKYGRRYTKDEKVMALAFYKMGPRAYRWWRNVWVLPSPITLSKMIGRASIDTGINANIFRQLKKRCKNMSASEKLCILMFDEMALSPHFEYNRRKDQTIGFVDNGLKSYPKIADHALVFMIRGVQKNYKQPIAFSFCSGSTHKEELKRQIKEIIRNLHSAGLKVVATVCDQGTSNVGAIKELIEDTRAAYLRKGEEFNKNVFLVDGEEVIPLFDPPHLMKGLRNNLLTKNVTCTIKNKKITGKWDHICNLYEENVSLQGLRLLPKLTEQHIVPHKIPKMKVKFATQVFSRSVAVHMSFFAERNIISEHAKETAELIFFLDELFDSVNGNFGNAKKRSGKLLLGPVTNKSKHQETWISGENVFKSMKFIDGNKQKTIPSVQNWIFTLQNFGYLKDILLNKHKLKSYWMRHFNQDPLENLFGSIRGHGIRNVNPTCAGFKVAFAAVLINNISHHSKGSNCEEDSCQNMLIKSLKRIFFASNKTSNYCDETVIDYNYIMSDNIFENFENKLKNPKMKAILEYVSGYVLRKSRTKVFKKCEKCLSDLYNDKSDSKYLELREYFKDKKCLAYPSMELMRSFSNIQDIVTYVLGSSSHEANIKNHIKTVLSIVSNYNFITCNDHKKDLISYIEDLSCNIFIYSWCKNSNRILAGVRNDCADRIQTLCLEYYNKRRKK